MPRSAILVAVVASLRRCVVASFAVSAPALAAPPTHERVTIDDAFTIPAGELCAFPVDFRATGRVLVTTHLNEGGGVDSISERPNINITLTNPANGRFVTDRDVGLDKRVFNPDGTSDVLSTSIHFKTKSPPGASSSAASASRSSTRTRTAK
jgi:hypothetical protein